MHRIVSYYARPATFSTGGVNTSRQQWMRAFADAGHEVVIASAQGGFEDQLVQGPRITFQSLPHWGRRRVTMVPRGLGRIIHKGDLVYLHEGWTLSNLVAAVVCRFKRIDYVVIPHGVYAPELVRSLRGLAFRRLLEDQILRRAQAVHLFFESEIEELSAVSAHARGIVAVTGLDLPEARWSPDTSRPYIAWIGRYDIEHKGIDLLFEALARIPSSDRPTIRMQGPDHRGDKDRVVSAVAAYGLEEWVFVGEELAKGEVTEFLARSKGFIHVPRWEAFGRTIVEALSVGVPVVLSHHAHISAALDASDAAAVVDGDSPEAIAEALTRLWQGDVSTGEAGRQWVASTLAWDVAAQRLLDQIGDDEPVERATS